MIAIVMLGGGAAFAASDPSVVYSSNQEVISVDNTYLVGKDLISYSPIIKITDVTADDDYYYVAYTLYTIDLQDSVWQDIAREETMQVSKPDLGPYRDLGVYVTEKMKDIVDREILRLADTQTSERKHVSQKIVATEYGGLIGKFLDAKTEQLPGYTPVIQPAPGVVIPEYIPSNLPGGPSESPPPSQAPQQGSENTLNTPIAPSAPVVQHSAPVLKVLGNNPAEIPVGSTYNDLGAVITSTPNNYGVHVFLEGIEMQQISLDTTVAKDWEITYKVTDQAGNIGTATRTVRVFDPYASQTPDPVDVVSEPVTEVLSAPVEAPASDAPATE